MKQRKTLRGVTIIETMLYLAIAIFVMGAFFSYGWDIAGISIKSSVISRTSVAAHDVQQLIDNEIRGAQSVSDISSQKLVLQRGNNDEVTIEYSDNAVLLKRGSDTAVTLNFADVEIDNFTFIHQDSYSGDIQYVGYSFESVAAYPGSGTGQKYQFSIPIKSGISLRTY